MFVLRVSRVQRSSGAFRWCQERFYSRAPLRMLKKPIDNSVIDKYGPAILYSSYLEDNVLKLGYQRNMAVQNTVLKAIDQERVAAMKIKEFPVALQHLNGDLKDFRELTRFEPQTRIENNTVVLVDSERVDKEVGDSPPPKETPRNWMEDYEFYSSEKLLQDDDPPTRYGTPDRRVPPSRVPCSGCGARLHCMDESLPGYLPSEIFRGRSPTELQTVICQRCHFLKHYNTALDISVKPEEYEQFLGTIKNRPGLIILIVDLLDLPSSIWPNMLDLLGHNRPMFIVGNKVDLIPKDSRGYLNHIQNVLLQHIEARGIPEQNIRHVSLISATTGYGVEELVTALHNKWSRDGDVYLCGVTNVGKSSLFNSLLRSDYCKSKAADLLQRATASPWPGTTIKMLKFPILRISDARKYWRTQRLLAERARNVQESQLRKLQAKESGKVEHATLMGHIGQSFNDQDEEHANSFALGGQVNTDLFRIDESQKEFAQSKWCFDTPGVITEDQMYSLLTIEELLLVKPKEMMRPRTYLMKPGMSLFLAGIARIDFKEGAPFIRAQVYSSIELPVLICETESAEEIYRDALNSQMLRVPVPEEDRLKSWPMLQSHGQLEITSENSALVSGDIVLSSCGWIGINVEEQKTAVIEAWTPAARGIYLRQPSMLPHGLRLKGARIRHSLAYKTGKAFIKQ